MLFDTTETPAKKFYARMLIDKRKSQESARAYARPFAMSEGPIEIAVYVRCLPGAQTPAVSLSCWLRTRSWVPQVINVDIR